MNSARGACGAYERKRLQSAKHVWLTSHCRHTSRKRRRGGRGGYWTHTARTWRFWITRSRDAQQRGSWRSRRKCRYGDAAFSAVLSQSQGFVLRL